MELSASMMCARFDCLWDEVRLLNEAGIDSFHVDIMDGMFVPNLSMGLQDIQAIRRNTDKPIEVHLMVCNNLPYLDILKGCGVNTIYIHPEGDYHPFATLQRIKDMGMKTGLVIDPGTSVDSVRELFNITNKVLIMAVNPGRAGQAYLPYIEEKVQQIITLKQKYGYEIVWDGACTKERVKRFAPLGVDGFVLGTSLLFGHKESYKKLLAIARQYGRGE